MTVQDELTQAFDAIIHETYKPNDPGAAVIIVKSGEVIYRNGVGMANLELGVPIEPDMVFRVGSVTKQFTAVAILMLMEQDRLTLDDPITRFLPDYPTQGHTITIRHLLTHTAGIKSYTDMPEWQALLGRDLSPQELIDLFKNQPMQFMPGEQWAYTNSGYVLLGAIIEDLSGHAFEQFLQTHIFDPLGMKHTCYDHHDKIIPRRASGYAAFEGSFVNAPYLSMTHPYAAGALVSSVDDLAKWDAALYTAQLLKQSTLQQAFVPHRLLNGTSTNYGFGWTIGSHEGHRVVEHNGGINGFRCSAIRLPDDRAFVAVLSNLESIDPDLLSFKLAATVIGKPEHVSRATAGT